METAQLPQSQLPPHAEEHRALGNIVCGTDFSKGATEALEVAAALAQRARETVILVHAINHEVRKNLPSDLRDSLGLYARAQLHAEREHLKEAGIQSREVFRAGPPDQMILEEASRSDARLLVLAASSKRSALQWVLGSVVEKVAEAAVIPTLVVRHADPLLKWTRGKRRLRVVVGADLSAPSEAALRWVNWLTQLGPCEIVVVYLEPVLPPAAAGYFPPPLASDIDLRTARLEQRHFRRRVQDLIAPSDARIRFEKNWGRSDAHLIEIAKQERADLIVVGTHSRQGWQRLGHHSVSRAVLHYAPLNVACVPSPTVEPPGSIPQ